MIGMVRLIRERMADFPLAELDFSRCQSLFDFWRDRPEDLTTKERLPLAKKTCGNYVGELGRFLDWLHLSRDFGWRKPQAFEAAFRAWVEVLMERLELRQIAIDGKTLRRSHDRGGMKSALHVVCAWSVENHLVLGQEVVADKSNEITAIPELLRLLELKGAIVTIDAMGCQKEIAEQIAAAGGDFVLAVKDNQPKLLLLFNSTSRRDMRKVAAGAGSITRRERKGTAGKKNGTTIRLRFRRS